MRRLTAIVSLLLLLSGCGLYGERGFSGQEPLSAPRFIEEVDEMCQEVNDEVDDAVATLYDAPQNLAGEDLEDAVDELRDSLDDLIDELPDENGPEDLEQVRDDFVTLLESVDEQLGEAMDALDQPDGLDLLDTAIARLGEAESELQAEGFQVCGVPRPSDD